MRSSTSSLSFIIMKTRKDLLFYSTLLLWLIINVSVYVYTENNNWIFYINNAFVIVLCIDILFKLYSKKFRNWLDKKL